MRRLYSALTYLSVPWIFYRLRKKSKLSPAYKARRAERFGFFEIPKTKLWLYII